MLDWKRLKKLYDEEDVEGLRSFIKNHVVSAARELSPTWHPLGFVHCKLHSDAEQVFRLHIWPANRAPVNPQLHKVHDHLFHVHSIVLAGAVSSREFEFIENDQCSWRIVRVNYQTTPPSLFETNVRGDLQFLRRLLVPAGQAYSIPNKVLHSTELYSSVSAVTIVRTSRHEEYAPRVVLPVYEEIPIPRQPVPLALEEWVELVNDALL